MVSPHLHILCFFSSLVLSWYSSLSLSLHFLFIFTLCSAELTKSASRLVLFFFFFFFYFLLIITRSGRQVEIRLSVCTLKSQRILFVSFSSMDSDLFLWSNFNFSHKSLLITFPTESCLVFYFFCANFLHSLVMSKIVSSISPHNLHLLFCWVSFVFALTLLLEISI